MLHHSLDRIPIVLSHCQFPSTQLVFSPHLKIRTQHLNFPFVVIIPGQRAQVCKVSSHDVDLHHLNCSPVVQIRHVPMPLPRLSEANLSLSVHHVSDALFTKV